MDRMPLMILFKFSIHFALCTVLSTYFDVFMMIFVKWTTDIDH